MSVSSYNYSIFSKFVYNNSTIQLPDGWSIYSTSGSSENGYFGQAYINTSTGEVVIAHRGTEPEDVEDYLTDFDLAVDQIPDQYTEDAKSFIEQVKFQMSIDELNLNDLTYTGHSLGGVLAQLSAIEEFKNGNTNSLAVVFDSPGVTLSMAGQILNYTIDPNVADDIHILSYMSSPNAINTTNAHDFGINYTIYPDFSFNDLYGVSLSTDYILYTLQQHDMLGIINQLNPHR